MTSQSFRVVGQKTPKVDGYDKVTGQSKFGADVKYSRMLVGKILRSPYAHARIKSIDTSKAEALPGVKAVITGADFPSLEIGQSGSVGTVTAREYYVSHEIMARDKAMFHSHAVAAVAATSAYIVEEALGLIEVEYEVLPHILDSVQAMSPDSIVLNEGLYTRTSEGQSDTPSNIAEHLEYQRGDIAKGFAEANTIVERSFRTQVVHQGYIEPDAESAYVHPDGSVEVWANTQATYSQRNDLALILDIPLSKIKVIPTEVGGAFGGKESIRVSGLCVILSRKAGQPVGITLSREESLRATGPGNATVSTIKVGAKSDGTITAIQAKVIYEAGAFPGAPLRSALRRVFSHYRTQNLKIDAFDVVTNKPHVAAYRAPGATPTAFALESVVDEVGETLGLDPLDFRIKNVSRAGNPMPDGVQLPDANFVEILERVRSHSCWTTPLHGPNRGRGIALGMWTMPGGTTSCHVILNGDGSVNLVLGTPDLSATRTSLAMVAAEALGLDIGDVSVTVGDTDMVAHSDPSAGDKVTYVTSKAVAEACADLVNKLKARVAEEFRLPPNSVLYGDRRFWIDGAPEMQISLADLALRSIRGDGAIVGYGSVNESFDTVAIAPNAAAHIADVEVDPETGKVQILNYTTFQDVGLAITPEQVQGQMQGGATQGIGWALSEEYRYDENGVLENATLLDYRLQTALDVPSIGAELVEMPSADHPLGIRAVGQVPIVPPAAAIANAINRATGIRMSQLPMNPERVFNAIREGLTSIST